MKRGRIKPRNATRRVKAWSRNFGEESNLVRLMPCAVSCMACSPTIEIAHDPSRGAGGGRFDIGPLCKVHHRHQGDMGIESFQARHGIDLRELWDEIALGHERPLGLRGVADRWWSPRPLTEYESDALVGWTRRARHRGLDETGIGLALDIGLIHAREIMELAA